MTLTLTVEPLTERLDGYGVVAMATETMRQLSVDTGEFISFDRSGKQATAAVQVATDGTAADVVALGRHLRERLGVTAGETVHVTRLTVDAAHRIDVTVPHHDLQQIARAELRQRLSHRIVSPGASVTIPLEAVDDESVPVEVVSTTPSRTVGTKGYTTICIEGEAPKRPATPPDRSGGTAQNELTYSDIGGQPAAVQAVREVVELPLTNPALFDTLDITPPTGVLLYGPPGTGKTLLARIVANQAEAHFEQISAGEIFSKWYGESESNLRAVFERARRHAPAIVYIDEIDAIAASRSQGESEKTDRRIVNELLTQLDGFDQTDDVVVVASTNRVDDLDPAVRRPGRFDREVLLDSPDEAGRQEILHIHTRTVPLADNVDVERYAAVTPGFTGADLQHLVQEAAMTAVRRLTGHTGDGITTAEGLVTPVGDQVTIRETDFQVALENVEASGLRAHHIEIPDVPWEAVGGLDDVIATLRTVVEWPRRYSDFYAAVDLDPASGVVLYGPPGTGKTHVAKALATESEATFLSVEGPELLTAYPGETEAAIRDVFEVARAHAPTIVFFDEIDAIASHRNSHGTNVDMSSIVGQLLTELDGIASNEGVTVVAATNRPDRIDSALLRPGRLGEKLEVGLPDHDARREILAIHTTERPLATDVDLETLATQTEGCSAATLAVIARRASRRAVCHAIDTEQSPAHIQITHRDFEEAVHAVITQSEEVEEFTEADNKDHPPQHGFA